ncbi:presequence translocated-associated motor subunit pam-17 [Diaporthe amygdali]|uniref:presequence translocated-associated motor subunit pam-17 n=1 Tax=Phomopsis amygdali TaxID=1214568 RepID=UPI0022FECF27|nr:presequence translocated-associated motor subunit pam-17 [Diaporthe amygdali]KAJ0120744.1 presequence translocated-associated motor subunit pam-17 [Diaporthe amygdali]
MIASTTTAMLRSGVTRGGCALQPILLRSTTSCPYSTITAASPFASVRSKLSDPSSTTPAPAGTRPSSSSSPILTIRRPATRPSPAARRHASSSSSSSSTRDHDADAAAALRAAQRAEAYAKSNPDMPPLDWNSFFQLRKTRRRWQVGFSAIMSLGCGTAGALVLGSGAADSLTGQIPLDPILTLGLITLGCIAMGWVVGPSVGNAVFYLIKRKYKAPMTVKESQFFARIKKNRVDPSNSSTGNPVPDFYGEKISSVAGYRQWLKDQRAYNKKRTTFI